MRSLLDPLPRQLSTKALAALVALVVCGTGISVARFLESSRNPVSRSPAEVRAAPRLDEARPPRGLRPSTRGSFDPNESGISSGPRHATADGFGAAFGARSVRGISCPISARDGEATLARPSVEGT